MKNSRTKIVSALLDNNVIGGAECARYVERDEELDWGEVRTSLKVTGIVRKQLAQNNAYQLEMDAIHTVGRLIREERIRAFTYHELKFERARRRPFVQEFNALRECEIEMCCSPIERSKFRVTGNFSEHLRKGGKKDKDNGFFDNTYSQIGFIKWLANINKSQVEAILSNAELFHLSEFEIESLESLGWFQKLCRKFGGEENYPDAFHLWTAERNNLDYFLTLENKMANIFHDIVKGRKAISMNVRVVKPTELLAEIGVKELDTVPIENNRFYRLHEINQ